MKCTRAKTCRKENNNGSGKKGTYPMRTEPSRTSTSLRDGSPLKPAMANNRALHQIPPNLASLPIPMQSRVPPMPPPTENPPLRQVAPKLTPTRPPT